METRTIYELEVPPNTNPIHHWKTFNRINITQVLLSWKDEQTDFSELEKLRGDLLESQNIYRILYA